MTCHMGRKERSVFAPSGGDKERGAAEGAAVHGIHYGFELVALGGAQAAGGPGPPRLWGFWRGVLRPKWAHLRMQNLVKFC